MRSFRGDAGSTNSNARTADNILVTTGVTVSISFAGSQITNMSRDRVKYLLFVVIMCVLINTGSCLKCYNCVAKAETDDCMDPKGHKLEPQECVTEKIKNLANQVNQFAQNFGAAIGIDIDKQTKHITDAFVCQKIESTVNNEKFVIRGCQVKDTGTDYCKGIEKQISGTITHCSLCEEDGCNAAHWMAPLSTLALLVPALVITIPPLMFL